MVEDGPVLRFFVGWIPRFIDIQWIRFAHFLVMFIFAIVARATRAATKGKRRKRLRHSGLAYSPLATSCAPMMRSECLPSADWP